MKGSTGTAGVIALDLADSNPPRISDIRTRIGSKAGAPQGRGAPQADGPALPAINDGTTPQELDRALDAYLSKLSAEDVFSGVALVAKNNAPVFQKAYGLADRANRIPNTTRTRFNVGSINKTFTRLAIDQLVAQGKLKYSDTLGTLFPTIRRRRAARPPSSSS